MPPVCSICFRSDRAEIDAAIVSGDTLRDIARRFATSKDAVGRHKAAHVSAALSVVLAARAEAGPVSALDRLEELYTAAKRVLDVADAEGKPGLSLQAIRELRGIVETLARVTGELDERPTVSVLNVHTSGDWLATRAAMLDVLAGYPAAARAVAARLVEVEA